jgi:hypothetical protein
MRDLHEAETDDFEEVLKGRRIVSINKEAFELTLDNGQVLTVTSTADCCAWFEPEDMDLIDTEDNVIVKVEEVMREGDAQVNGDDYDIVILSASKRIARIGVVGSEGSGYYVHSIGLRIEGP